MNFREQLTAAYQKKVVKPHENLVRKTALMAFTNIALATPVKSGRARANWNISVDTVDASTTDNTAQPNFVSKAADAVANFVIGKTIYISNNLPYIKRLNNGYSKQAPASFVETGVALAKRQAGGK